MNNAVFGAPGLLGGNIISFSGTKQLDGSGYYPQYITDASGSCGIRTTTSIAQTHLNPWVKTSWRMDTISGSRIFLGWENVASSFISGGAVGDPISGKEGVAVYYDTSGTNFKIISSVTAGGASQMIDTGITVVSGGIYSAEIKANIAGGTNHIWSWSLTTGYNTRGAFTDISGNYPALGINLNGQWFVEPTDLQSGRKISLFYVEPVQTK